MGRKGRGARAKAAQPQDGSAAVDRGALAQCLNATSQIAAECNSILRDLLRGRWVMYGAASRESSSCCCSAVDHTKRRLVAAPACARAASCRLESFPRRSSAVTPRLSLPGAPHGPPCRSPQHQDLQRLASQVLMGQTMNLQELQKKMESQHLLEMFD
jgi:hypothetical protein